jgi:membrane fusion protein, multidrug efflux system
MNTSPLRLAAILLAATGLLAGCERKHEAPPPVRPVLSTIVKHEASRTLGFAGTVQPRYSTKLGFRVLGRIISRAVNVGDIVKNGTHIASLDPVALTLAVRLAESDLASAKAQLSNAEAIEARQQILSQQQTASQAIFESALQARQSASASVTRAEAGLTKAKEQLGYAELVADGDGVVTSVDAEVGQVVAEGQTVVEVARSDIREAVIDVPESVPVAVGSPFDVSLQIDPDARTTGTVREIAPQADAATRTRRVKITLTDAPESFRLGTTIDATLTTAAEPGLELPRSALLEKDGTTSVWVVDPAREKVSLRAVTLAASQPDSVRVATGIAAGDRVVTAGVHSLTPDQSVKIIDGGVQ